MKATINEKTKGISIWQHKTLWVQLFAELLHPYQVNWAANLLTTTHYGNCVLCKFWFVTHTWSCIIFNFNKRKMICSKTDYTTQFSKDLRILFIKTTKILPETLWNHTFSFNSATAKHYQQWLVLSSLTLHPNNRNLFCSNLIAAEFSWILDGTVIFWIFYQG